MNPSVSVSEDFVITHVQGKKRKRYGRITDVSKKLNLQSHETGSDCRCKRLKCFDKVPADARQKIVSEFNLLKSVDEQNIYLCGLISVCPIQQRRPRNAEDGAMLHDSSFAYRVRVSVDGETREVPVCFKAFLSLHGITKKKLEILQKSLKMTGKAPTDKRGRHLNRPLKLKPESQDLVVNHIRSFKGRQSHYSLKDSSKIYLPDDLNIKKMYNMYKNTIEDQQYCVSYETYRSIFSRDFNISFGYPRSDTCSICDEYLANIRSLEAKMKNVSGNVTEKIQLDVKISTLRQENLLHKHKAEQFYSRKKAAKLSCRVNQNKEAICMDFAKNLPVPNISTNDVYYKRQLSIFSFNIHVLSTSQSIFYTYPETNGRKGCDEVCSMLHHFVYNFLPSSVRVLEIFCDSCGGQNKNYTVIRYLYHLVHVQKRFDEVKISFPIRGHSFMECDKDFGLIQQKSRVELPNEWAEVFRAARVKPNPFDVMEVTFDFFKCWTTHFSTLPYKHKCPMKVRPIRELKVVKEHPRLVYHRSTWNGIWETAVLIEPKKKRGINTLANNEFKLPGQLYKGNYAHNIIFRC